MVPVQYRGVVPLLLKATKNKHHLAIVISNLREEHKKMKRQILVALVGLVHA